MGTSGRPRIGNNYMGEDMWCVWLLNSSQTTKVPVLKNA